MAQQKVRKEEETEEKIMDKWCMYSKRNDGRCPAMDAVVCSRTVCPTEDD